MPDANGIPTTFEMDGLFTEEDIRNRHQVMLQCIECNAWTQHDIEHGLVHKPCGKCGKVNYDWKSLKSKRTFNVTTDVKRKPKK